jgi:hypothetical protein
LVEPLAAIQLAWKRFFGIGAGLIAIGKGLLNLAWQEHMGIVWWLLGALLVGLAIWIWARTRPQLTAAGRMQFWKATLCLFYLYLSSALLLYALYSVWASEAPQTGPQSKTAPVCSPGSPLAVTDLDPAEVTVAASLLNVRVLGCGFTRQDTLTFNGAARQFTFVGANQLVVSIGSSDLTTPGFLTIEVTQLPAPPAPSLSSAGIVHVTPVPKLRWYFWSSYWDINDELRLLLLVLFAGALGSSVYALKSLADYIGDGKLVESWFTFYLIQPLEGAGIAFIYYVVVRGGFFSGSSGDLKTVNVFGVSAIATLVGVFSDKAFLKLKELFDTLFKAEDDRTDNIAAPTIQTTTLPSLIPGTPYSQTLQATGGTPPYTWTVESLPASLTLDPAAGTISGTPVAGPVAPRTFTVTDSEGKKATVTISL